MTEHGAPIDLDALAWDYLPRRHNEGDDRVLVLIQRLREAEELNAKLGRKLSQVNDRLEGK